MQTGTVGDPPFYSPITVFSGYRINALWLTANCVPIRDRLLVTAFPSPARVTSCEASISGSTFPASHFASQLTGSPARSAFPLCYRKISLPRFRRLLRFRPVAISPARLADRSSCLGSPPGLLPPSGSKLKQGLQPASPPSGFARFPFAPRYRRLFLDFRLRIDVPDSLRFRRLAVPQTSWNLLQYGVERLQGQWICDGMTTISTAFIWRVSN